MALDYNITTCNLIFTHESWLIMTYCQCQIVELWCRLFVAHSFHSWPLAAKDSVSSSNLPSVFLCGTVPVPQLLRATHHKLDWLMKRPCSKPKLSCFGCGHCGVVFAACPGLCKMPQAAYYGCFCATRGKDTVENDRLADTVDLLDSPGRGEFRIQPTNCTWWLTCTCDTWLIWLISLHIS